ncbi:hypothetical protein B0H63DRAFT_542766, partial [Podospora didyma]
ESVSSLSSRALELPPSCIEFCKAFPSYFLVGTYNLQKDEDATAPEGIDAEDEDSRTPVPAKAQSRNGSIILFEVTGSGIVEVQSESQPSAILDVRFNPNTGHHDICAAVSSTGTLALFRLSPDGEGRPLKHVKTMDISTMASDMDGSAPTEEVIFTSFGWHPSRTDLIAITAATGHVHLVHLGMLDANWTLFSYPVITHTLEAWCVVISPCRSPSDTQDDAGNDEPFTIFSGGDDSALRYRTCTYDALSGVSDESLPAVKVGGHGAGVTAILPLPLTLEGERAELVVTGSYDENIRLFWIPSALSAYGQRAKLLAGSNLEGGVWRLNLIDVDETPCPEYTWRARILASCMHAGARVVALLKTANGEYDFNVIGKFEEHESMNYGSDFQPYLGKNLSVISTSFYDKLMCQWTLQLP